MLSRELGIRRHGRGASGIRCICVCFGIGGEGKKKAHEREHALGYVVKVYLEEMDKELRARLGWNYVAWQGMPDGQRVGLDVVL